MKQIIFILTALFLTSCDPVQKSVGFTTWSDDGSEYQFFLGTESSVNVVKAFDAVAQAKTYDDFREIFADSATLTYQNGVTNTLDQFIAMNQKRDSLLLENEATLQWTPQHAFSVDIDPTIGGEHVNMMYKGQYIEGEQKSEFYASLWFYVVDGKIVTISQYNQAILAEE